MPVFVSIPAEATDSLLPVTFTAPAPSGELVELTFPFEPGPDELTALPLMLCAAHDVMIIAKRVHKAAWIVSCTGYSLQ